MNVCQFLLALINVVSRLGLLYPGSVNHMSYDFLSCAAGVSPYETAGNNLFSDGSDCSGESEHTGTTIGICGCKVCTQHTSRFRNHLLLW